MTQSSAEKVANVAIGVAAIGVAVYVLKTPHLRRLAWQLSLATVTGMLPAWISQEVRGAWEASGQAAGAAALPATRAS
jgi:hypothetical protein